MTTQNIRGKDYEVFVEGAPQRGTFTKSGLNSLQDVVEINTVGNERMWIYVTNTGANPLSAFQVWYRPQVDAPYVLLAQLASDYTAPIGPIIGSSGDLVTLAAGATGWISLDVAAVESVKLAANSTGTTLSGYYGGK